MHHARHTSSPHHRRSAHATPESRGEATKGPRSRPNLISCHMLSCRRRNPRRTDATRAEVLHIDSHTQTHVQHRGDADAASWGWPLSAQSAMTPPTPSALTPPPPAAYGTINLTSSAWSPCPPALLALINSRYYCGAPSGPFSLRPFC